MPGTKEWWKLHLLASLLRSGVPEDMWLLCASTTVGGASVAAGLDGFTPTPPPADCRLFLDNSMIM
jgi:hypothetical protein